MIKTVWQEILFNQKWRHLLTRNVESKHEAVSFVGSATQIIYSIELQAVVCSGFCSLIEGLRADQADFNRGMSIFGVIE